MPSRVSAHRTVPTPRVARAQVHPMKSARAGRLVSACAPYATRCPENAEVTPVEMNEIALSRGPPLPIPAFRADERKTPALNPALHEPNAPAAACKHKVAANKS